MNPIPARYATLPIRVVLADDHDLVRSGLALLLGMIDGVEVVAEARTGRELLEAAERLTPDLVITDISMPDMDGFAALQALRNLSPPPRILVISMHDSRDFIHRAVQLGAHGYLMKESSPVELEHAVHTLMRGLPYLSAAAARRLVEPGEAPPEATLTSRQIQILSLLASGLGSKEIAFHLGLSSKTIDVHRARIMERLALNDLATLTLYAVRHALVGTTGPVRPRKK